MIEIDHLSVRSDAFRLEGVSLDLAGGEYGVLMGPSGAGKTTLLEAVCGLRPIAGGVIRLAGRDVTGWPPADRRVGYAPQDGALFTTMRVRDNLAYGLRVRRLGRERTAARVDEVAELLGLQRLLDRRPTGLSGGEMRRVAIGRAIAFAPAVLLLDEPLAGLDGASRDEVRGALQRVRQATRTTTLHVSHDAEDARQLADRVFWLEAGRLSERKLDAPALERLPHEEVDVRGPLTPKPNAPTSA